MSTTLQALQQACAKACGWYARVVPSATAANTYTWTADGVTSLAESDDQSVLYQYVWARVESDSAVTPLDVGEVRRVSSYTVATSIFTLLSDRGFTSAPTATMVIGLYRNLPPVFPDGTDAGDTFNAWRYYINRVLKNVRYRRYSLLTLVTDGDMETSGTTNWTASNATLTKSTTAAYIAWGAQSLRVANTSANGYGRSALVAAAEGDVYVVRADLNVESGTAVLEAYDETNSTSIDTRSTDLRDWRSLSFQFTVPADCHSISVRLKGTEASADVYWDNVSLRPLMGHRMDAPSWVEQPNQVEGVVPWSPQAVQGYGYMAASQQQGLVRPCRLLSDPVGATGWRVEYEYRPLDTDLLWLVGLAPYAELSAYTDSTTAPQDLVVAGACLLAAQDMDDEKLQKRFGPRWWAYASSLPRRTTDIRGAL